MAKKKARREGPSRGDLQGQIHELTEANKNYKETIVHVKASQRAKAHDETRRVRVKDQSHFNAGVSSADYKKFGPNKGTESGASDIGGPDGPTRSTGRADFKQEPNPSSPAIPRSYFPFSGGTSDPYGTYGNLSNFSGTQLAELAAARASEIYNGLSSQMPQSQREEHASSQAILELQTSYESSRGQGLSGKGKKASQIGINTEHLNPGEVRQIAFAPQVSHLSKKEQELHFGTKNKMKTNVGNRQMAKPLTGSVDKPAPKTDWQKITADKQKKQHVLSAGDTPPKAKINSSQFMKQSSSEEREWIQQQTEDPKGLFFGMKGNQNPGSYRRWQRYINAREAGYQDRDNISTWLKSDTRGRKKQPLKNKAATDKLVKEQYTKGIVSREGKTAAQRNKTLAPSHEDFGVGIRVPGMPSDSQFKDMNPDASAKDIFEMKEAYKQSVADDIEKNTRAAHEERQEQILGRRKSDTGANGDDRVVFLTTSAGYPAVSASANSLLGQYIIKKRKGMLYDQRMASRASLKGEFPTAVRDQHVIEIATGLSLGAQGRYGAFRQIGYRVGDKKSKGYGKMLPVGSQVLRDSNGQALYDRNGNLRYSDGFTRPFDVSTTKEVGLRIYLG